MNAFSQSYSGIDTEFNIDEADFTYLEIRDTNNGSGFHYFYDTKTSRLITDFVLEERKQVSTLCQVTLIKKDEGFSPRIRLWKKDKTKVKHTIQEVKVPEDEITTIIKATVDTGSCHKNFWKIVNFLQTFKGIELPEETFQITDKSSQQLADLLKLENKEDIISAVRIALGSSLTEKDINLIANRKLQLEKFEKLLTSTEYFENEQLRLQKPERQKPGKESVWQQFFEANSWIFGYGLSLISCESLDSTRMEQITTGANIFTGAGKRSDAVLRSKGYISSLVFCEIKTHDTPLLESNAYRPPDVYRSSTELSGALSQIQKTVDKALRLISSQLHRLYDEDGEPMEMEVSTIKPKQVIVIGNLKQLTTDGMGNREKTSSFELYRNSIHDVEIITFDELYHRARFIVQD